MVNRFNCPMDLFEGIETGKAEPDRSLRKGSNSLMGRGSAVEPWPAENARGFFQSECHIRWGELFEIKGENGSPVHQFFGAIKRNLRNLFQTFDQFSDQMAFVLADRFDPLFQHKPDAGKKSGDADSIGRSALKSVRKEIRLFLKFGPASCPTLFERNHLLLMDALSNDQPSCPLRSVETFMPGKGQEVDPITFHIDGIGSGGLGGINQK